MSNQPKLRQLLSDIAQAINDKGVSGKMTAYEMPERIASIQTGLQPTGNIELHQKTATDVSEYATATVQEGHVEIPNASITQNPSISVSNDGLISVSLTTSQKITPIVQNGWVDSIEPGTIHVDANATSQLDVQIANSITPNDSIQTAVSAGLFTVGDVVVQPVPVETRTITENGTVVPSDGKYFSQVVVNVPTSVMHIYRTGIGLPSNDLGEDGDVYFDLS